MIHGKKRNKDLFRRLTENWGYTKPGEATPLDEQMAEEVEDQDPLSNCNVYHQHCLLSVQRNYLQLYHS